MSAVGLFFVGAVLFVDALVFLGRVAPRDAAPLNLLVGALQVVVPLYLVTTATTPDEVLLASGIFLFGFTYLWVGIAYLTDRPLTGFGWYSAWVSVVALGFAVTEVVRFHDTTTALLWFQWSALWGMFFVVIALGRDELTTVAGVMTLVMAFTTATVPGFLILLGSWDDVPAWGVGAVAAATVLVLLLVARSTIRPDGAAAPSSTPPRERVGAGSVGVPA